MAHIYGDNARRRDVRGRLRDRRGAPVPDGRDPAHREGDARRACWARAPPRATPQQLTDQDFSDEELTAQFNKLDERFGAAGARTQADILAYIDGINARIDEVKANPNEMPAEYPALGATPESWTVSDTAAMAVLLVTQFTVSNGGEEVNAEMQQAFRKRFGSGWRAPYRDLREAEDPEAYVVAKRPFLSDRPGPVQAGAERDPRPSARSRRATPQVEGPGAAGAGGGPRLAAGLGAVGRGPQGVAARRRSRTRSWSAPTLSSSGRARWPRWGRRSTTTRRRSSSSTSSTAAASTPRA